MPLNILLADDSIPAQNMGKKILVDAGYHVLTVSNGLEALRRIADAVPDIAILDIFMPGYTGLEICERLRASQATAMLPVILTVGKLEPYRPQDGEHVHSNAVIVKPFAAAELVSAVRSLIGAPATAEEPELREVPLKVEDSHDSLATDRLEPQFAGDSQEPDEPLFAMASAAQVQRDELFFSNDGPESLVFNPDAEHTPFSASAIDLLPVASHASAIDTSAFTEFDLEPEVSHYSPAALNVNAIAEPAPLAAPAVDADTGPAAYQSPVMVADAVIAPDPVASISSGAVELESAALGIPARDPLLEMSAEETEPTILDSGESSTVIAPEVVSANSEGIWAPPAPAPDQQEEARRLAFEELFNSTEPFPVENPPENHTGILPSMADLSTHHPFDVEPDSEIESLIDEPPQFIASEPDPYLMQEEEPPTAVTEIHERDPRLECDFEDSFAEMMSPPRQTETALEASGDSHSAAEERNEPTPMSTVDSPAPETQNLTVEAHSTEPEIPAPALSSEIVQAVGEAIVEGAQFAPEVVEHIELAEPSPLASEPEIPAPEYPAEIPQTASESTVEEAQVVSVEEAQFVPEVEAHSELTALTDAEAAETQNVTVETDIAEPDVPALVHPAEIVETALETTEEQAQIVPEVLLPPVQESALVQKLQSETETEPAAETPEQLQPESTAPLPEMHAALNTSSPEVRRSSEAERIHQAVERVFDRFKPLLVAAIMRELVRHD